MTISGLCGFLFFLVANFTNFFSGLSIFAGCLQLSINVFVFIVWRKAFLQSQGFKKVIALFGVVVPIVMASTTLVRVFIPTVFN